MSTFAILSLALLVVIVGVVAVVARQLWQTLRSTMNALRIAGERLRPLASELQAELAVTTVESEALRTSVDGLRQPRLRRRPSLNQLRGTKRTSRWPRRR